MNVINQARQLAESIKQTDEYKNYIEAKNRISENEEAKRIIAELNNQMKLIENAASEGDSVDEAVIDRYDALQQEAMKNDIMISYYDREKDFSELMNQISEIISDIVEI